MNTADTLWQNVSNNFLIRLYLAVLLIMTNSYGTSAAGITNCPMEVIQHIIVRTREAVSEQDAALQMQVIRRIMEDIYGGNWGVLIIKDPELISTAVHWTFPDHKHRDGSAAFCLHMEQGWQYNVFKTGDVDTEDRMTVEQVVEQLKRHNETQYGTGKQPTARNLVNVNNVFSNSLLIDRN